MSRLRFLTSGESHGPALIAILDGIPAGLPVDIDRLNHELWRRQQGYGRGSRQKIETDKVEIVGGVRHGITSGAPLGLSIKNRDWENWRHVMSAEAIDPLCPDAAQQLEKRAITRFRPGHADLPGTLKFRQRDIRDVLERASARETAARVAVGALCLQFLEQFGVAMAAHVLQVGSVKAQPVSRKVSLSDLDRAVLASEMFCSDSDAEAAMISLIKTTWQEGDSLGGVVEVLADGLPVGLGTYTQWDGRLDGLLAQALMSVQAIKAVEVGDGVDNASRSGSTVHDPIVPSDTDDSHLGLPFKRTSNHAGGIEGGMTNGERLQIRAYMKPIPTLRKGLPSVSYPEFKADIAHFERSDVCAISAASVVCKAMVAFVLAREFIDKFGGDTLADIKYSYQKYLEHCRMPNHGVKPEIETQPRAERSATAADLEADSE
jgi:chorismate synthase